MFWCVDYSNSSRVYVYTDRGTRIDDEIRETDCHKDPSDGSKGLGSVRLYLTTHRTVLTDVNSEEQKRRPETISYLPLYNRPFLTITLSGRPTDGLLKGSTEVELNGFPDQTNSWNGYVFRIGQFQNFN